MYGHDLKHFQARFEANGWRTLLIDGHNIEDINQALKTAVDSVGIPTVVLARTIKGKGVSFIEDVNGWHGKPLKKGEELDKALQELGSNFDLAEPLAVAKPAKNVKWRFRLPPWPHRPITRLVPRWQPGKPTGQL